MSRPSTLHKRSRKPLVLALVAALGLAPLAASAATISVTSAADTNGSATRVRVIDYDTRGYPAHFGAWELPPTTTRAAAR